MRRPLKPFVTEYKQSTRRNPAEPGDQGAIETERSAQRAAEKEPDDSYEAAMRAADALFSAPRERQQTARSSEPRQPDPQPQLSEQMYRPEKNGGRILRVIDEEPPPQYAALEAARAPKRRGRKPGSKNKPKVALVSTEGELAERPSPQPSLVALLPKNVAAITQPAAEIGKLSVSPRSAKRFPWGGNRIRPGEDWKRRRLPKVCW